MRKGKLGHSDPNISQYREAGTSMTGEDLLTASNSLFHCLASVPAVPAVPGSTGRYLLTARPEQTVVHGAGSVTRPRVPSYRRQKRLDVCPLKYTGAPERRQTDRRRTITSFTHTRIYSRRDSEAYVGALVVELGRLNR
ncbi:hypothetical protein PAMA_002827 [Pampus argenteus]